MKKIVIIPGGFHPYHAGHRALYDAAREAFPSADVFVAATDDTSERPFPFKTKRFLAQQAGIPGNRFIRVKSPFRAEEITQMYDPDDTQLIFVRSEKDAQKQPQAGGVKKDGSAAYLQPYKRNGLEPFRQHGYMVYLPTVQFGPGMTSATEIRAKWPEMTPEEKISLVQTMYPSTVAKDAAAGKIVSMLDEIMMGSMAEGMNGAQASLMGAATGAAPSLLNPTPTPMANAADRPRRGVRMGVEFDETDTGLTTSYQDGVTTRTVTPAAATPPDLELVRQKDELSQQLRAQGMTGAEILKNPKYRELSRRIRGIEEQNTVTQGPNKGKKWSPDTPGPTAPGFRGVDRGVPSPEDGATAPPRGYRAPAPPKKLAPAGTYGPVNLEGYNTSFLQKIVTSGRPAKGITPAQAMAELRLRINDANPDFRPSPEFTARYLQGRVKEATLVHDPDEGLQIRPAGGMGTWDEQSLVSNLARKFADMVEMVKNKNYAGLHHALYRAGVVENMVRALAELEAFQAQQGRRPIARGREIDTTDYLEER